MTATALAAPEPDYTFSTTRSCGVGRCTFRGGVRVVETLTYGGRPWQQWQCPQCSAWNTGEASC